MYVLNAVPSSTVVFQYESIVLSHMPTFNLCPNMRRYLRVCPAILKDEEEMTATRASWHACDIHEPDVVSLVHVFDANE